MVSMSGSATQKKAYTYTATITTLLENCVCVGVYSSRERIADCDGQSAGELWLIKANLVYSGGRSPMFTECQ